MNGVVAEVDGLQVGEGDMGELVYDLTVSAMPFIFCDVHSRSSLTFHVLKALIVSSSSFFELVAGVKKCLRKTSMSTSFLSWKFIIDLDIRS